MLERCVEKFGSYNQTIARANASQLTGSSFKQTPKTVATAAAQK